MPFKLASIGVLAKCGIGFNSPPADTSKDDRPFLYTKQSKQKHYLQAFRNVFLLNTIQATEVTAPVLSSTYCSSINSSSDSDFMDRLDDDLVWARRIADEENLHEQLDNELFNQCSIAAVVSAVQSCSNILPAVLSSSAECDSSFAEINSS